MPRVHFTPNLARHVDTASVQVDGATARDALDAVFAVRPQARGYVLDDQGALRKHVQVFVDGGQIEDRQALSDAVAPGSELWVMQALSGG